MVHIFETHSNKTVSIYFSIKSLNIIQYKKLENMKLGIFAIIILFFATPNGLSAQNTVAVDSFTVQGNCGMCKKRIEMALSVNGVKKATWSPETDICKVWYQAGKISLKEIHQKIAAVGYATEMLPANEKAYQALPKCCQYRTEECADE